MTVLSSHPLDRRRIAIAAFAIIAIAVPGCSTDSDDAAAKKKPAEQPATSAGPKDDATSGTDTAAPSTKALDVCTMLTPDEVAEVLGQPATGTDDSAANLYGCHWEAEGESLNILSITVMVYDDAGTARSSFESARKDLDASDISGLGDEAFYNVSFGLSILSGPNEISVDATGDHTDSEEDVKKMVIKIGRRILEQL